MKKRKLISDLLFKEIYGSSPIFLNDFLNSFFSHLKKEYSYDDSKVYEEVPIQKFKNKDKGFRGDVLVVLPNQFVSMEAYSKLTLSGIKKTLSYVTRIYSTQMKAGEKDYTKMRKVVSILIAGEVSKNLNLEEKWFQEYKIRSEDKSLLTDDIEIYILRLDKVKEVGYNEGESDKLILHLKLMGAESHKERKQIGRKDEVLMTIAEHMVDFMNDRETNEIFSIENTLKHTYTDIGREEGEEIGEKRGEENKQLEIAHRMLKKYKIEEISEVTGLSIDTIKKLKEENIQKN